MRSGSFRPASPSSYSRLKGEMGNEELIKSRFRRPGRARADHRSFTRECGATGHRSRPAGDQHHRIGCRHRRQLADIESKREPHGIEPGAGRWKTWAISSTDAYRLPAPPDRKSTMAEIEQLKALASQRDAAARQKVAFWDAGAPSYRWVEVALNQFQAKPVTNPRIQRGMAPMTQRSTMRS